jgi:uncharacterized protein (TIGR03083 family)
MTLSRSVAVPGMNDEYEAFAELIESLTPDQWESPTRCEGWTVADVAGHVVGQLSDVVALRLEGLGTPEATARQVDERRGRTQAQLVDELRASAKLGMEMASSFDDEGWDDAPPGGVGGTVGSGIEALWYDTYLHADDIRHALGMASVGGKGETASLSHIAQLLTEQGWGPADLRFGDLGTFPVSGGGGRVIEGDALQFILAATGRSDPVAIGLDDTVNIYRA